MSVPATANHNFWSPLTTFKLSGVTYPAVGDVTLDWGYEVKREVVTGGNVPYYGTGAFEGKVKFEGIGSSDNRWENAATITSGILPTFGMTAQERDTQGLTNSGARTWTISGKFYKYSQVWKGDDAIKFKLEGEIVTEPTVVQS